MWREGLCKVEEASSTPKGLSRLGSSAQVGLHCNCAQALDPPLYPSFQRVDSLPSGFYELECTSAP